MPNNTSSLEEKGTLATTNTQEEYQRFREIERNIEFITPIPKTPQPTASPTPTSTSKLTETPVPTPSITPTPYVWVSSAPEVIYDAICNQALGWNCQQALNIAWCESRWEPRLVNPSSATGLFQVKLPLWAHYFDGDPFDPYVNARAAFGVYSETFTWKHWACSPY